MSFETFRNIRDWFSTKECEPVDLIRFYDIRESAINKEPPPQREERGNDASVQVDR